MPSPPDGKLLLIMIYRVAAIFKNFYGVVAIFKLLKRRGNAQRTRRCNEV